MELVLLDTDTAGELTASVASARKYMAQAKAPNTLRAYRADWGCFNSWCLAHFRVPLPAQPETVALYLNLTFLADAGRKPATIQRRLAAIGKAHSATGQEFPASLGHACVSEVWQAIKRCQGHSTKHQGRRFDRAVAQNARLPSRHASLSARSCSAPPGLRRRLAGVQSWSRSTPKMS